ncbi:hypothetical protein EON81_25370 [bacterium]|nr:MAG: hypothetical protein EON81_25370 [bacterium]
MLPLLTAALVLSPQLSAPKGPPKPMVTASQAGKGLKNLKLRLLPRMMLLPLTNEIASLSKGQRDAIVNGYTAGLNETVKTPKGASYELVPLKTVQEVLQNVPSPYVYKDKDDHTV